MRSRERVLEAINHRETKRVPIDFGGHQSSGISAIAYARLKKALGITTGDIYVYDMIQQLAIIEPEVLDAVGADVVDLGRGFMLEAKDWKGWELPNGTRCKIPHYLNVERRGDDWYVVSEEGVDLGIQKKGCLYFEQLHRPWAEKDMPEQDFADLEEAFARTMWGSVPAPGRHLPLTDEGLDELARGAKKLRQSTDRAIMGTFGASFFETPQFLYGMDRYLLHMAMHPEACVRLSEALCSLYLPRLEKWLGAVGPYVDIVRFGDDFGGQNGPLLSPQMYRSYYKPFQEKLWRRTKELAGHAGSQLHSCGGIEPLLDDLIEAGLEMVNPVQITCQGMDAKHLKTKYGGRLVLWGGGCDTRQVLPQGTPEEVRRHVREQVGILRQGGGFVFQQVHNIQADVPAENILAMFEAVRA